MYSLVVALSHNCINLENVVHDVDFVLETVGGANFDGSQRVVKATSTIVNLPSGSTGSQKQKAKEKDF